MLVAQSVGHVLCHSKYYADCMKITWRVKSAAAVDACMHVWQDSHRENVCIVITDCVILYVNSKVNFY